MNEPSRADHDRAFQIRCASKRGQYVANSDIRWIHAIQIKYPEWTKELSRQVWNATLPFGAEHLRKPENNQQEEARQ